jgi:hypothetical protein
MSNSVTKVASSGGTEVVRLSHFNIGSHALRPEHVDYLRTTVAPVLDQGGSVLLMGMASRSGSAAANQAISQRRTDEVLKRLRSLSKANFKVAQNVAVGEKMAADSKVKDGTEDPYWRAVQVVYWREKEPPPPPTDQPKESIDVKKAAEILGLEEHDLTRLFNQYNWTIDGVLNVVGLVGEFAPIAVAAAEAISVGGLFLGTITQFVGFFAYLARLDQEDGIRFGTWGACYMVGDWVVTPRLLTDGAVFEPTFPDQWVKNHFSFAGASKFPQFRKAWLDGAKRMGQNINELLQTQYAKYAADAKEKGKKATDPRDFERFAKLSLLKHLNATKNSPDAQGSVVTNYVYAQIRPKMEERSNLKIYLKELPYPSEDLNLK